MIVDEDTVTPAPPRAGYFMGDAGEAQPWIDLYMQFGGFVTPRLALNQPRWYGFGNKLGIVNELNTAYFSPQQPNAIIEGTQSIYAPKSGFLDIFIASPRQIGYNAEVEET